MALCQYFLQVVKSDGGFLIQNKICKRLYKFTAKSFIYMEDHLCYVLTMFTFK